MKKSTFLLIVALLSFISGTVLFLFPWIAAKRFGMEYTAEIGSLLRGMGGLIIGSGLFNLLIRNTNSYDILRSIFLVNILTHTLGILADFAGIYEGALFLKNIFPVQIVHLFSGIGSLFYLLQLKKAEKIKQPDTSGGASPRLP